ncbi:hypothetical protein MGYG_06699 [Nannizzia gypsea CBS 118893]|uniref:Uncharacterized protein n=1 Tax=Arthroderma gypseum (strain ATCC MYA-4604 / CBS 118893) TaxID=535722 RepID=E4V0Y7_ARTGP|nr:hypothetical protein MGYG_06699 [Nannizzia gypsea CBS 118893]EFR03702.1 hypothetical protein MGYG_06699 [Nannizzia gypsea CBS 118893]
MFDFEDPLMDKEKCLVSIGNLPVFVDPAQPPQKRAPFSAILGHAFNHKVELILPREVHESTWSSILGAVEPHKYARVIFPLSALLEGEFFTKYIKIGNVLMISEGRRGIDNVYTLKDGVLTLELDKATYERAGLVGKAIRSGDRKHIKSRYMVEINLRPSSMLHGKKGFERIVWAFKNVLKNSITWLFVGLSESSSLTDEADSPIKKYQPQIITPSPVETVMEKVLIPPFSSETLLPIEQRVALRDTCDELQEWLALVSLDSDRIRADDSIDPYLSRYQVPQRDECQTLDLVKITWRGLITSSWVMNLLLSVLRKCGTKSTGAGHWFGLLVSAMGKDAVDGKDGYSVIALPFKSPKLETEKDGSTEEEPSPRRQYVCWEYFGGNVASS